MPRTTDTPRAVEANGNTPAATMPRVGAMWPTTHDGLPLALTQAQLAKLLNISERKLERDRHTGLGPRFCKIGRRILYRREDVLAYLEAHCFASTAEAKRGGR
jgi:Helix-turn-helix domain